MKWRAVLRIEREEVAYIHNYTNCQETDWAEQLIRGVTNSFFGGVWVPVEVDEDDVYPF